MTPTLIQSLASHRAVARMNRASARRAKTNGHKLARRWHVETAWSIRADIRALATSCAA